MTVRFCSPEDREAAMEKQPFALDGGVSVRLVREGETSNVRRIQFDCLAHVALLRYPKEQRNEEDIRSNCGGFGHLLWSTPPVTRRLTCPLSTSSSAWSTRGRSHARCGSGIPPIPGFATSCRCRS
jgi:hypothetical protein